MRSQLNHLMEVAQLPNVSVRILRLADEAPIILNSFDLLRFGATIPDVVYTEHFRATLYFEGEIDTYEYRIVFQRLLEGAIDDSGSLEFIDQTARQIWT